MENAGVTNGVIKLIINDDMVYQLKKRKKKSLNSIKIMIPRLLF